MRKLCWIIDCKVKFLEREKKKKKWKGGKVATKKEKVESAMGINRSKFTEKKIPFSCKPVPTGPV